MPRNGAGSYSPPAGQPVVTNTIISSSVFNALVTDVGNTLTTSIASDGQTPMTANLSLGTNKITNLATGTVSTDATNKAQVDAAILAANTATQVALTGENLLTNGSFLIAQRGQTYALTSSSAYGSIDGWVSYQNPTAAGIFNQVGATPGDGYNYRLKVGRNNGAVTTSTINFGQALDSATSVPVAGKTVILSFYAKAGANYSAAGGLLYILIRTGTGSDQSSTAMVNGTWTGTTSVLNTSQALTTTDTRYTFTAVIPSSTTQIGVQFGIIPVGTAGADDNVYMNRVKLEVAVNGVTTASNFNERPIHEELARCQRQYHRGACLTIGYAVAGGNFGDYVSFPTTMRAVPSLTQIANNVGIAQVNCATTTSTYFADTNGSFIFRGATATLGTQFSETFAATAEL